ncbi:MAG: YggS family pyridoxal phosphate-dependent enzyme [Gemmatimonadota bacterium]
MTEQRIEGLTDRLERVRERIARAAERGGRDPDRVEVLPVTKGHPASLVRAVAEAGLGRVGENRVQEAEEKRALWGDLGLEWHMIGHLQRNKARRAVKLFDVIESVDTVRLARRLSREAEDLGRRELPVLVQVNAAGERQKSGFALEALEGGLAEICDLPRLRVIGLMTMAPLTPDEAILRRTFRETRRLFEEVAPAVSGFEPRVLSMGMSNDFEIAVEEGSTRLRLGTSLFGERPGQ